MKLRFSVWKSCLACALAACAGVPSAAQAAQSITINNASFEDADAVGLGGGVWPEADSDPANFDYWIETGPVNDNLNAFPPELIPPGFLPPEGATLDTGVFTNSPVVFDGGNFVPNPTYITNADGGQVAYLFASSTLNPGISIVQYLDTTYEAGLAYTLTVGVGKSFYLPPQAIGGSGIAPSLAVQLLYEAAPDDWQVLAQTNAGVGEVFAIELTDFLAQSVLLDESHAAVGQRIGIAFRPLDGSSGVWTLDDVRLVAVPEPASAGIALMLGGLALMRRRRCK